VARRGARSAAAAPAILALLLPACGGSEWTVAAEKSIAWTAKTEAQASLFVLLYGVATAGTSGVNVTSSEDYAVAATADVAARLGPCVTTTTTGAKDTYTFASCGAARGLERVEGTIAATYALDDIGGDVIGVTFGGKAVDLGASSGDLALAGGNVFPANAWAMPPENRAAFHLAETSPPATNTENRDALITMIGDFSDHGCDDPKGLEQSPSGISAAHGFLSVDDAEAWTIDTSAYHRCAGGCPAAGATIQIELAERITVRFDGGATAHAENITTGDAAELPLGCTP
jgi:hypothetical protein